ncbi:MAG: nitroreductase/quinone reductase family protein [Chloroflexota bacterium]
MNRKPNALQKSIHRLLTLKWVSAFLAVFLYRLDATVWKLSGGKHTVTEIVGLPIIQLTTLGAKTGQPRAITLVSLFDGEKIALIGSNFGGKPNPGWYYNLKANPKCTVQFGGYAVEYVAQQVEGEERERYWRLAVSYYAGYEKYKERAAHRQIPVMLLERVK